MSQTEKILLKTEQFELVEGGYSDGRVYLWNGYCHTDNDQMILGSWDDWVRFAHEILRLDAERATP